MSEAEKDKIEQRRSIKRDEENTIKTQLDTLKQERAQQAEARYGYNTTSYIYIYLFSLC